VTQQPGGSGPDLIGEFQRWLIRSSARGVGRQVTGQIRSALGRNQSQQSTGDVWETATTEPPDEAPECAWCPLCRAARLLRESKPGRDTRVTAVSDALGTVVQDAFSVLEAALAPTGRPASGDARRDGPAGQAGRTASGPAGSRPAKAAPPKAGQDARVTAEHRTTQRRTAKQAAAQPEVTEPSATHQGPGNEPAPDSPEGSPHEPDDRG
jgi:hypothetical protein